MHLIDFLKMLTLSNLGVLSVIISVTALIALARNTSRPKNFLPGPPTVPILGNIHQIPAERGFLQFKAWAKQYGSIYSLKFGSKTAIIVTSGKHMQELLEKRGKVYSARPRHHIGADIITQNGSHALFMGYNSRLRAYRGLWNQFFNKKFVHQYIPIQNAEAIQLMHDLMVSPENHFSHVRRNATGTILAIVWGIRAKTCSDSTVEAFWRVEDQFMEILEPGATPPLDTFKFLQWLPDFLAPWRKRALEIRAKHRKLWFGLLDDVRARVANGDIRGGVVEKILAGKQDPEINEENLGYVTSILLEASSSTLSSHFLSFILALTKYPEVLHKAQEELDRVCGTDRSPIKEDQDNLPYIQACIYEILRWRTSSPYGVSRESTEDDWYKGYFIPAGSLISPVLWAISADEDAYEDVDKFNPDRYINSRCGTKWSQERENEEKRYSTYAFGAGRRACPGEHYAMNNLFLLVSKLLWTFDITVPVGTSVDTGVTTAYSLGISTNPLPFPVDIKVRSEKHREVIERELLLSDSVFATYDGR